MVTYGNPSRGRRRGARSHFCASVCPEAEEVRSHSLSLISEARLGLYPSRTTDTRVFCDIYVCSVVLYVKIIYFLRVISEI